MINLTNLIALFRHHRKRAVQPCPSTCFCHRVEEIIKEETEPKSKPKVIELTTRRQQSINKLCKQADDLKWADCKGKPDDYTEPVERGKSLETDKPKLPSRVLDSLIENAKKPYSGDDIVASDKTSNVRCLFPMNIHNELEIE